MINDRMVKKLYELKPVSPRLAGRPKIRWENDVNEDLKISEQNLSMVGLYGRK
jgi:hypothetical protein